MPIKEIAASLYAWDLADEGVERCLGNLQERASCNSAYLVGVMHKEKRPLHQRFYPHNPKRKYYCPEDSRVYWKPDMSCYTDTPLRPLISERDFLKDVDWLDVLIDVARRRGMKTGCEVSHTIVDASVALSDFRDILQQNVYGEIVGERRPLPCLNNPKVQSYLIGLFRDIAKNHDVDFVQTCLILFGTGTEQNASSEWQRLMGVALGGCFCPACKQKAKENGLDWDEMYHATRRLADVATQRELEDLHEWQVMKDSSITGTSLLLENPGFAAWLRFRVQSVSDLFKLIKNEIEAVRPSVDFRYNTYLAYPELAGLDFRSAFHWVDSVRESDYSDQLGTLEALETKRQKLLKIRRVLGDKPLIAALGVRPKATPEILRNSVRIAVETGCDGLSLGHYDGATMARLEAVTEGLREAEAQERDWLPPSATAKLFQGTRSC